MSSSSHAIKKIQVKDRTLGTMLRKIDITNRKDRIAFQCSELPIIFRNNLKNNYFVNFV